LLNQLIKTNQNNMWQTL